MASFFDTIQDLQGRPIPAATMLVTGYPGDTSVTIFQTDGTTIIPGSTVTADQYGFVAFVLPSGSYNLTMSVNGFQFRKVVNVQMGVSLAPTIVGGSMTGTIFNLTDAGNYYTTKNAESALQQVGFQILQSVVTPEYAGATGASAALDTAAWQTILTDPRRIECFPNRVYQINAGLIASVRKRINMNGATLQAASALTHLLSCAANQLVVCDGILDGNLNVTDCLTFNGGANSIFEAMTFKRSLRDTVWFGNAGVNDQVQFNTCFAQQAGTTYTSLTATTTGGSATVTLSAPPNALVRVGDFIVIVGAGGGYGAGNIHVITGISGSTLTVDNSLAALVPANTVISAACSIYSGSGWHFTHSSDASLATLNNCNSSNTAACGAQDESLYGHRNINTDHQASLIGTSIGRIGGATTNNAYLAPPYFEHGSLNIALLYQQGNNLKIDSSVLPTMAKYVYTPGPVYALSWQWQDGNNNLVRNYQEYVNAGTITMTDEQDATFVQSGGAGNVTVKLPDAPYFADRPQVFNFAFALFNSKTFTVTSTSSNGTLINGIAGLTGVAFAPPDYSRLTARWSQNQNGWVLEGNAIASSQPAFAYASNLGTVVTSTTPNHVVETRSVTSGLVTSNITLEATIRAFLTGANNTKSILVGLSPDSEASALTATFTAGQTGIVTFNAEFVVSNTIAGPHQLISRADLGSGFGLGGTKRASITFNPNTTPFNLVTQAWVANASDSITIDSIEWRVRGAGL